MAVALANGTDRPSRDDLAALIATHTTHLDVPQTLLRLDPGKIVALEGAYGTGLTRVGLSLLVEPSRRAPVAVVDARGWLSPLAAWEVGIEPGRLFVIREVELAEWSQVVAALLPGIGAVYAEVPAGISDGAVRRLAAIARRERSAMVLRPMGGRLPAGIGHLRIRAGSVEWEGADRGHGRLGRRALIVEASGKALGGMERAFEVEDDGKGAVHLVERLAAPPSRRFAG